MCISADEISSPTVDEVDDLETVEMIEIDTNNPSEDNNSDNQIIDLLDNLVGMLRGRSITVLVEEKLCDFMKFVGACIIRPMLKEEYTKFSSSYKSVASLSVLDSKEFLKSCNQMLTTFLLSVTGRDIETMDKLMLYRFSVCIENIYHLKNSNLILPHCFVSNLIQRTTSGSRTVTEINAKTQPAASDASYRNWLNCQGSSPLTTPSGDIDVYIDNIGKYIEKAYRVSASKNRTPTVVTAVLNIPLQSDENIQQRYELRPTEWNREGTIDEGDIQEQMLKVLEDSEIEFRNYRYNYIERILNYVASAKDMEVNIAEEIKRIDNAQFTRQCNDCSKLHLARKQKCSCGGRVSALVGEDSQGTSASYVKNNLPKYFSIGEILNMNSTDLSLNEPIMENPNSVERLRYILDTLKPRLITADRKWVFIGADGPPYTLMRQIVAEDPEKYDWVILVSGRGHLGMNQLKTFFKVADKVFGEVLGKEVFNFNSEKSYSYFIQCKDNHKAWQSLEVFLHGLTMELIFMYMKSLDVSEVPNTMGFLEWLSQQSSLNRL